jgi:hypothetical protein
VRVAPLVVVSLSIALACSAFAQGEDRVPTFNQAVETLVQRVRQAAPDGVTIELNEATPADLGWRASGKDTPARALVIMAPSGAARVFGLLPRVGTYTPEPDGPASVITIGPDLVVVGASQLLQVALTMEELERARPALERASAPILAWEQDAPGNVDTSFVRGTVAAARRRAHYVAVDVAAGGSVDLAAAWKAGVPALVYRVVSEEFVPPTIAIAPR